MTSRRSFFAGFARVAAIIAMAPQIAFGVINKTPVAASQIYQCFREYYKCPMTGKWKLFNSPDDSFFRAPPDGVQIWRTEWGGGFHIDCIMAPESVRRERLSGADF